MHDPIYEKARKRVKAKKGFYSHLGVYIAVGTFFFLLNILITLQDDPEIWFFYPLLPWGAALAIHYFSVFGLPFIGSFDEEWEERQIEQEIQKMRPPEEAHFPETDFESLDLPSREIIKEKHRDSDFV